MPSASVLLSSVVSVQGRFLRSVHLERDYESNLRQEYHVTASARSVMAAFENSLQNPANRAMSLIGPFGAGKSAFCVRLAQSLRDKSLDVRAGSSVIRDYPATGMVPILVVGSREPILPALVASLDRTLHQPDLADVRRLTQWQGRSEIDYTPKQVADLYLAASRAAMQCGKGGIVLIADEVGKFLEYAALEPKNGDIFVLQELAEAASRSDDAPFIVITVLHQSADSYAQKLGRGHRNEWMKIGERFRQVPFFPSDTERIDLVTHAIRHATGLKIDNLFGRLAERCVTLGTVPPTIDEQFVGLSREAYPLHPLTLIALPALFRRIGQSHRSMFGFLSGDEPHSFGRYLSETTYDATSSALYTLDMLFEYATEVMSGGWSGSSVLRSWIEAADIVEHAQNISPLAKRVLRCVALISLIKDNRLKATEPILCLALASYDSKVADCLRDLEHRKLIAYSRSREQYRLLEAGDVDVEAALDAAKATLPVGTILHVARNLCPPPPIVARRHSYQTGVLREALAFPCTVEQLQAHLTADSGGLRVLLVVADNKEEADRAEKLLKEHRRIDMLICVATPSSILQEAAANVSAADHVGREIHELKGDRPARKELALRRSEAETAFTSEWDRLFGYGNNTSTWYHNGETLTMRSARQFYALLSTIADETYPLCPRLRNELINRSTLSSAAAAGRRNLIESMLMRGSEPRLGISGYPPELSMYECVLRATRIHRESGDGNWKLAKPERDDPAGISPTWSRIEEIVFQEPPSPQPIQDIYGVIGKPPYGITGGIKPIILAAFLLANVNEVSLYREGTFLPEPSVADFEVLMRRPELFALAGCRVQGDRQLIVDRLARGFGVSSAVVPVVRAMLKMVRGLPEHTWKTRDISKRLLALRDAFEKARSPERLLFHDLPIALDISFVDNVITSDGVDNYFNALNSAISEWAQVMPNVIKQSRDELLAVCGYESSEAGWLKFRQDAVMIEPRTIDQRLRPLLTRSAAMGDSTVVIESVLALLANRPTKNRYHCRRRRRRSRMICMAFSGLSSVPKRSKLWSAAGTRSARSQTSEPSTGNQHAKQPARGTMGR